VNPAIRAHVVVARAKVHQRHIPDLNRAGDERVFMTQLGPSGSFSELAGRAEKPSLHWVRKRGESRGDRLHADQNGQTQRL
jgi:hypothetical protein